MSTLTLQDIPFEFPVAPLKAPEGSWAPPGIATCGACGLSWDDTIATLYTPAPSGRCPFEAFHKDDEESSTHHSRCWLPEEHVETVLTIAVGRREDGTLSTVVQFPDGETIEASQGEPDIGLDECTTCLHDVAHTLLAARIGLDRSPVLERVVDLRPLSQEHVDLEEAATFAVHAWSLALRGEQYRPAIANVQTALARLPRFEARATDHGFRLPEKTKQFATFAEAVEFLRDAPSGRSTTTYGRVTQDVTWRLFDLETGEEVDR
jgi:hypothetical protein